jgi:hypothetical protein
VRIQGVADRHAEQAAAPSVARSVTPLRFSRHTLDLLNAHSAQKDTARRGRHPSIRDSGDWSIYRRSVCIGS